jgi:LEA14-like dessication related protein
MMRRLLPLLFVLLLSGCSVVQQILRPPTVRFDRAAFGAATFDALNVDLIFSVSNPNVLGAQLDGYSVNFQVDGLTLLDGTIDQRIDLSGGATTELVLPVTVRWEEIAGKIGDWTSGQVPDDVPWSAKGSVGAMTTLGRFDLPFDISGRLPVIVPPVVVPAAVRFVHANPMQPVLAVDVAVTNPSGHAFGLRKLDQALTLQGRPVISSRLAENLPVAPRSTETRTVEFSVDAFDLAAALLGLLGSGGQAQVGLTGSVEVDTGLGVVPFAFDVSDGLRLAP